MAAYSPSEALTLVAPITALEWKQRPTGHPGYYEVRALEIPGAELTGVWANGRRLASSYYRLRGNRLYWRGLTSPPDGLQVEVRMRKRVVSMRVVLLASALSFLLGASLIAPHVAEIRAAGDSMFERVLEVV